MKTFRENSLCESLSKLRFLVADPGFHRGGANLPFGQIIRKTAWKWRKLDLGLLKLYYVDPPLILCLEICAFVTYSFIIFDSFLLAVHIRARICRRRKYFCCGIKKFAILLCLLETKHITSDLWYWTVLSFSDGVRGLEKASQVMHDNYMLGITDSLFPRLIRVYFLLGDKNQLEECKRRNEEYLEGESRPQNVVIHKCSPTSFTTLS